MASRVQQEDKDQLLVQTPYGKGVVIRTREDGVREVHLLEWEKIVRSSRLAAKQYGYGSKASLKLYTTSDWKSVEPKMGDDVITPYGRGRLANVVNVVIKKKKTTDEVQTTQESSEGSNIESRKLTKYQIELSSWRLAGKSKVKCFLFPQDVKVVRKKRLEEMNATERVEFAQRQKASAVSVFGKKQYQQALNLYAGAVDAVRFVQHDASSSNEVRADLVEVMVTCSNNAATCCVQMGRWPEAAKFAQNAIVLLDALYNKRGLKIHTILNRDKGLCDAKIFGEWRVKSLLIIARACAERKEYADAIDVLKRARNIIGSFCDEGGENEGVGKKADDTLATVSVKQLHAQNKEVQKLLTACMERKKVLKKREKQRAKAMFGGGKKSSTSKCNGAATPIPSAGSLKLSTGARGIEEEKKEAILERLSKNDENIPAGNSSFEEGEMISVKPNDPSSLSSLLRPANADSDSESKSHIRKSVSFSNVVEEREIESDEENEAWFEEHKEALLLLGLAGLATLSFVVLRGYKRS